MACLRENRVYKYSYFGTVRYLKFEVAEMCGNKLKFLMNFDHNKRKLNNVFF